MNALENRIPPPLLFAFTALMMWLIAHFTHRWHIGFSLKLVLVMFFVAIAGLLAPTAVYTFRKYVLGILAVLAVIIFIKAAIQLT